MSPSEDRKARVLSISPPFKEEEEEEALPNVGKAREVLGLYAPTYRRQP
jgi:hypothetical protein